MLAHEWDLSVRSPAAQLAAVMPHFDYLSVGRIYTLPRSCFPRRIADSCAKRLPIDWTNETNQRSPQPSVIGWLDSGLPSDPVGWEILVALHQWITRRLKSGSLIHHQSLIAGGSVAW